MGWVLYQWHSWVFISESLSGRSKVYVMECRVRKRDLTKILKVISGCIVGVIRWHVASTWCGGGLLVHCLGQAVARSVVHLPPEVLVSILLLPLGD